jgi:hypothetical protein
MLVAAATSLRGVTAMKSFALLAAIFAVVLSAVATQMARGDYDADRRFEPVALSPHTVVSRTASLKDARGGVRGIGQYSGQRRDVVFHARPRRPDPNYIISFTASGFLPDDLGIPNAPVDPVTGTIFISLDPTVENLSGSSVAATLNIQTVHPFTFSYYPASTDPIPWLGAELNVCSPDPECTSGPPGFVFGIVFHNFDKPNGVWAGAVDYSNPNGAWYTRTVSVVCTKRAVVCKQLGGIRVCRRGFLPCP